MNNDLKLKQDSEEHIRAEREPHGYGPDIRKGETQEIEEISEDAYKQNEIYPMLKNRPVGKKRYTG